MIGVSDADLLLAWEQGDSASPVERAVVVAACAAATDESVAEWTVGRRDAVLLDLHIAAFGDELELVVACPACAETLELTLDAAELRSPWGEASAEYSLEADGERIAFRLPTSADVLAVLDAPDVDAARRALAERCILGTTPDALSDALIETLASRAAELDPQADIRLALVCVECGHAWKTTFDVAGHVWREVAGRARALEAEIVALAAAFGWSEREILALPRRRRRRYLDLAGA